MERGEVGRRAQMTLFVILALILFLLLGIGMFIYNYTQSAIIEAAAQQVLERRSLPPIKTYIERCLIQSSNPAILSIANSGGSFVPSAFTWVNHTKVNQLCTTSAPGQSCENNLLIRQQIEFELKQKISKALDSCISLDAFRVQGRLITEGERDLDVKIDAKEVRVILHYPINSTLGDQSEHFDEFRAGIDVPLGMMLSLATDITNEHITSQDFDYVQWMLDHYDGIKIERHKPYPHIVYVLEQDGFTFRFSLGGAPTVGQYIEQPTQAYGCCVNTYDNLCYQNANAESCSARGGRSLTSCTCDARSPHFEEQSLLDCEQSYNPETGELDGPPKSSGESWCSYDSITGQGYDYIGSRHYRHTCMNGRIITEECRDYREELCTEDRARDGSTVATCRPNRYYDCSRCSTQECCESDLRDCHWNDWFPTELKCTPQVPPGLRFWDRQGADICLAANEKKTCQGLSCPNEWIDGASLLCAKMGDCGNKRTISDTITFGGFFESDMSDNVRDYVYLPDGLDKHTRQLRLDLDVRHAARVLATDTARPAGNLPALISSMYGFADDILRITFSDFVRPFTDDPIIEVTDFTYCDVANAPVYSAYCRQCGANPQKPCTEYACKAFGERCVFDPNEGDPTCTRELSADTEGPIVRLNKSTLFVPYRFESARIARYRGMRITPAMKPGTPLMISVETDEPARCRLDYAPRFQFTEDEQSSYSLPSLWMGDAGFAMTHTMRIRMPPGIGASQKLMDTLNFTSTQNFTSAIDDLSSMYENYRQTYRGTLELYEFFSGDSLLRSADLAIVSLDRALTAFLPNVRQTTKEIMDIYLEGGLVFFITCVDRAGNENLDPLFVMVMADRESVDRTPSRILGSEPSNGSLVLNNSDVIIYLDEPAECRFDNSDVSYDEMNGEMDCATSVYELSSYAGGSYACTLPLTFASNNATVFVRCKDQPRILEQYELRLIAGDLSRVMGTEDVNLGDDPAIFVSMSADVIDVPAILLEQIHFEFDLTMSTINLNLYVDDPLECRFAPSVEGFTFDEMESTMTCARSDEIARGPYVCRAALDLADTRSRIVSSTLHLTQGDGGIDVIDMTVLDVPERDVVVPNDGQIQLIVRAPANQACRFALEESPFDLMAPISCIAGDGTICDVRLAADNMDIFISCEEQGLAALEVAYTFSCADKNDSVRNVNSESTQLEFMRADPIHITALWPSGQVREGEVQIHVFVDGEDAVCGYAADLREGYATMRKTDDGFVATIEALAGSHEYLVMCRDSLGSSDTQVLRFYAVAS